MADLLILLTLLAIGVLSVLLHWYRLSKKLQSYREELRVIRVKARGTAFASNYRVWKWVYREILDIGER
ncbi:hypothetical protein [Enterobacter cloacae]|uniref:hypothetical protein n=1 Tax=Enterobacter cloacae TaxID=550 RepID=UPI003F4355F6